MFEKFLAKTLNFYVYRREVEAAGQVLQVNTSSEALGAM
jgi:hypothetical protein